MHIPYNWSYFLLDIHELLYKLSILHSCASFYDKVLVRGRLAGEAHELTHLIHESVTANTWKEGAIGTADVAVLDIVATGLVCRTIAVPETWLSRLLLWLIARETETFILLPITYLESFNDYWTRSRDFVFRWRNFNRRRILSCNFDVFDGAIEF